jgi:cellobiose phosphorylase
MKYGYFDDNRSEYVITSPETPTPWINYLGCEQFFSLFSQTGGGYCFYRDARLRRITRYRYNSIPLDSNGRYFYIRDDADHDYWSIGYMPVKRPVDHYECRHGLGYSTITSVRKEISTSLLVFVPLGSNCEVLKVTVENQSKVARRLKLFSFVEFCLWNALDDMTNFQRNLNTGEVEVDEQTIYHVTEYRERRNHFAFFHVNQPIAGFDTDRETFLGSYNGLHEPAVVRDGRPRNSMASGWSPIASHCLEFELRPGECKEATFLLGYAENSPDSKWRSPGTANKEPAKSLIESFQTSKQVSAALKALASYWRDLFGKFQLEADDPRLGRMVNVWNPYQCMVTFNLSRSASYYESGIGRGMGFRDCNQDLLGVVHMVPDRARERILDLAATQFPDGSAYHQYQPLTKRGNHDIGNGFNDDPLWLILAVCEYTKETGDYAILQEIVPFDNNGGDSATLLEHLQRSFEHVVANRGPHGLPLIGRADWNDCLNLNCYSANPDESFQSAPKRPGEVAESVLIAGMFVFIGDEYAALLHHLGDRKAADVVDLHLDDMRRAVMRHGFDGDWYLRAYDADGKKIGSRENDEGQIFAEPQGFCAMAGIGREKGWCERALDSVAERLLTDCGIILQQPAYSRYRLELGEISSYPPGYKENAGIFCHNNPWVMIAEAILGRGDKAYDYYKRLAPAFRDNDHLLRRTEPYVYAQMIGGPDAPNSGEAKNSWLTGTAAWNYVAISQFLLGIRPRHDGLLISPAIANQLGTYRVQRRCRGANYRIIVRPTSSTETAGIFVNGIKQSSTIVPHGRPGSTTEVEFRTCSSPSTLVAAHALP